MSTLHPTQSALSAIDTANVWINSEPLTAERLRGRVALVDFWTYSCVNWLRTLPYVRAWEERYHDRGLVVVGAHAPEFGFEHDVENVLRASRELDIGYPVVIDNEFTIWRSFENHYWPAVYLVDREGNVRFHHFGEEAYEETERALQQLLGVEEATVQVNTDGLFEAADWDTLGSPETYLGSARGERRSDPDVGRLAINHWSLTGAWSVGSEAAVLDAAVGSVGYRSRPATSTLSLRRRPPALQSASPCASRGRRLAIPTASTSTRRARGPSPSPGCTSSCASERQSPSATSRSRSSTQACALTSSPSADTHASGARTSSGRGAAHGHTRAAT